MSRPINAFFASVLALMLGAATSLAFANESAADFVDTASAKGMAEIETSKLALEKGTSEEVKAFAQQMITDHSSANTELNALAKQKNLEVSTEADLMSKAKAMVLKVRDGESFDAAYANSQVMAHEQVIELFTKQAESGEDADLKAFASAKLPTLKHHLEMAKALQTKYAKAE